MGHNIQALDVQVGIKQAWHGLTKVVPEVSFANSGHAFEVLEKSVQCVDGTELPGYRALISSDKGNVFMVARESYKVIQNQRIWEILGNTLSGVPHTIESAGSVGNRSKFFVSVDISKTEKFNLDGRTFENYLNFHWSHDGTMGLTAGDSSTCVVCQNTFNVSMAAILARLEEGGKKRSGAVEGISCYVKHTSEAESRIGNFEKILEQVFNDRKVVYQTLERFAQVPVNQNRAERIFAGFLTTPEEIENEEISTRKSNQIGRLTELFSDRKQGNRGENLLDVFSATTDYYSHESSGETSEELKQLASSEFGTGRNRKNDMFGVLVNAEKLSACEVRGEKALSL